MLNGALEASKSNSLMSQYSAVLGNAILRHRARIAERAASVEAELAGRIKSEFITNMSHELRTPLNTVIGFSKLISEHQDRRLPDKDIVEFANLIHGAAGHLLSIINDILDISKIQSGKYTLDSSDLSLGEVVEAAMPGFRLAAEETGVRLGHRIDPALQPVRGDAVKIRQIVTNLVNNAIKFTQEGGLVMVEAARRPAGGAVLVVRDTGVGMSDEEIRVALTPFGQVDGARSRWREGTGLGLPIAKALVELHGGRLQIRSVKSRGTEVAVMLPARHQVSIAQARDAVLGAGL
ncbi:MAG: HAMP domain-containing histidine kinase [Hyphomicrobiaceae bacterium]|nr:HAMP domain-containing histidine kinase [Hyphomicrobiaceae bacterium]